jgi:hypothetical protein
MLKKIFFVILFITSIQGSVSAVNPKKMVDDSIPLPQLGSSEVSLLKFLKVYKQFKYPKLVLNDYLYVSIKRQKLFHIVNGNIISIYTISASKNGVGSALGSNKTPEGLHSIVEKFGYAAPKGGVLFEREYTGKVVPIQYRKYPSGEDNVTTRVLWLKGEEPGRNKGGAIDSYSRAIYIHGTPAEGMIGKPASNGCIRMKNSDVIDLFNFAYVGMKVLILNE